MRRGPLDVALSIALFAGLAFPFFLRQAFAQEGYRLADSAAVQRLPDRQGGLSGMKTSVPRTVTLPDGTNIVVYVVEKIDIRKRPPFKNGDVLYAVNGLLFTSMDGMPRYVQSLAPGSTATVELLQAPRKRWNGRSVPVEQMPSVLATVEIFSTHSRYAQPPGPPPTQDHIDKERRHVAKMAAFGFTLGTAIQAGLNALGIGPEAGFSLGTSGSTVRDTGLTPAQRNLLDRADKLKERPPSPPPPPPINQFYGDDHTVK
jgi:hypothetical protein